MGDILLDYHEVLAAIRKEQRHHVHIKWFSDTFLFFMPDGSPESFLGIDSACRAFFQRMLLRRIPLRGSLTVGKFYVESDAILIGPALVEAYDYAERQDWLGFVLTPKACRHLKGYNKDGRSVYDILLEHYYRPWDVPIKAGRGSRRETANSPAYTMNLIRPAHGTEVADEARRVWDALIDMQERAKDRSQDGEISQGVFRKYENTKRFLLDTVPALST